ncbi:MAG: alpha/beta hydrolase [Deltaproteobacteria bacterium]|nr:alpha/beta hydrolase [Deltaproteobacteria bacterium]
MTAPREHIVESLGLPLHYLEWGEPGGEPLVLVHGFLDLAYSWRLFVAALQAKSHRPLRIIAPDCRGHGDSGWVGAGGYYHFPDYVYDLDCVLRAAGISQCKLIGHSMGGTIAFQYSGTFANRVTKLVLIEGVGPVGMEFSDAPARMQLWIDEVRERGRRHFREYTSIEAGASQLRQSNPRLNDAFALDLARAAMKQNHHGKWVWKFDPLHRTASPQPFYSAQALEFFRRIECPVLIVDGQQSRQTRRTDKQQRYQALRDQRHVVIDNAGHMVHQDNPERLAEAVAPFLEL